MKIQAFSLLDTQAGAYHQPFFMVHVAQAMRAVVDLAQDPNTTVGRYPADFALCLVGVFDDATGRFTPQQPENLGNVAGWLEVHGRRQQALPLMEAAETRRPVPANPVSKPNGSVVEA